MRLTDSHTPEQWAEMHRLLVIEIRRLEAEIEKLRGKLADAGSYPPPDAPDENLADRTTSSDHHWTHCRIVRFVATLRHLARLRRLEDVCFNTRPTAVQTWERSRTRRLELGNFLATVLSTYYL